MVSLHSDVAVIVILDKLIANEGIVRIPVVDIIALPATDQTTFY
ncbi:MAG: hypothetical protein WC942_07025 [Clostridia bacterium]|jgi:hypothetical protein